MIFRSDTAMAGRQQSSMALLASVMLGLVAAGLIVWRAPSSQRAAVLLTRCNSDGCVQFDSAKKIVGHINPGLKRRRQAQNTVRLGMLGSVGEGDLENDEGVLFAAGAHTHKQTHPDYWIDEKHDLNGKKLDGESKFAPGWWSKGRSKMNRPYVVWGSRYAGESGEFEHADDVKLTKYGVNVEGRESDYKFLPIPSLDKSEYNFEHATGYVPPTDAKLAEKAEQDSAKKLRDAGVLIDGSPLAEPKRKHEVRKFDGMGDMQVNAKKPCVYKRVDEVGGLQRQTPYFNDVGGEETLEKAGVNVHGEMHTEELDAASRACEE